METFLTEPTLFDDYIAADPSVWWNQQTLVRHATDDLAPWTAGPKQLYIATADDPDVAILLDALAIDRPAGVTVIYEPMPDLQHSTIFPFAALRGIRAQFGN